MAEDFGTETVGIPAWLREELSALAARYAELPAPERIAAAKANMSRRAVEWLLALGARGWRTGGRDGGRGAMTDHDEPSGSLDARQDEDLGARWAALLPAQRATLLEAGGGLPAPGDDLAALRALGGLRTFGYLTGEGDEPATLTVLGARLAAFGRGA